jgi:hypothetical protein
MGGTGAGFARPYYGQAAIIRLIRPERTDTGSVIVGEHPGSGVAGQIDGGESQAGRDGRFLRVFEGQRWIGFLHRLSLELCGQIDGLG